MWDKIYKSGKHFSVWPWTDLITLVQKFAKLKKNSKVLELGCGVGANIPFFLSKKCDYHGIEQSSFACKYINKKFKNLGKKIIKGDAAHNIPFEFKFDLIVDRGCSTHLEQSKFVKLLDCTYNSLKKRGIFILTDLYSKKTTLYKDYKKKSNFIKFKHAKYKNLGLSFYNKDQILRLFKNFKILDLEEKIEIKKNKKEKIISTWKIVALKK